MKHLANGAGYGIELAEVQTECPAVGCRTCILALEETVDMGDRIDGTECEAEVRQIVEELRGRAEDEKLENNRLSGLLGGTSTHLAKQNAYEEAAEMLEERILEARGRSK